MVPVAVGQLPRSAALGGDHEDVRPPGVDIALPVALVRRALDHLRFLHPVRAFGPRGQRHAGEVRPVAHPAGKGDPLAVRGPDRVGRPALEAGDLRDRALRIHPADEDLRAPRFAGGGEEDAGPVRRPLRAAAFEQVARPGPVGVHDVKRRLPAVVDLVDPAARVDDLRAVRRDLRVRHRLHIEVLLEGEGLLGGGGGGGEGRQRQGECRDCKLCLTKCHVHW